MMTYPAPTYQHHTVPIGGAPFVPPSWSRAGQQSERRSSNALSSGSSSTSVSRSPSSSPTTSSATSSNPYWNQPESPSMAPTSAEAAQSYSRQLHRHTASMWEMERQNIEKSRLWDASPASASKSPRGSFGQQSRHAPVSAQAQEFASATNSRSSSTLDFLLGRSKSRKESQASSSSPPSSSSQGHRRIKSLA